MDDNDDLIKQWNELIQESESLLASTYISSDRRAEVMPLFQKIKNQCIKSLSTVGLTNAIFEMIHGNAALKAHIEEMRLMKNITN